MPDSIAVLPPGWRATDSDDQPISGAKLNFYEAGTNTAKTVYSDSGLTVSLGSQVTCDSGGYPVSGGSTKTLIYTGTDAYKVVLTDADDVTIWTHDNVRGADVIPTADAVATPENPVVYKTSAYTVLVADRGKLIKCDPTSGTFAITLLSAVTAGDGFVIGIRHSGDATANVVTIRSTGGEYISKPGHETALSFSLIAEGETAWIVSDGTQWTVMSMSPAYMHGQSPFFVVEDRLTAAPASPIGGNRYIVNGTATGSWSTLGFVENQIVESDGNGSWLAHNPGDGWIAYVKDENTLTQYRDSAWVDLSNITAPNTSDIEVAEFSYDGTGTNSIAGSTWTTVQINTTHINNITGASIASNQITLPTGKYLVFGTISALLPQSTSASVRSRLFSITNSAIRIGSNNARSVTPANTNVTVTPTLFGYLNVTAATEVFALQWFSSDSNATLGTTDSSGVTNKYAALTIIDLNALQGPQGAQGPQGPFGYTSGDGGTVTQATNKSTGVTLNNPTGAITMNSASLGAASAVSFTLTNSEIAADDVVVAAIKSGATAGAYSVTVDAVAAGSCRISLRNHTGGALGEAVVIQFCVFPGATS